MPPGVQALARARTKVSRFPGLDFKRITVGDGREWADA
jgi:hypothetical protein